MPFIVARGGRRGNRRLSRPRFPWFRVAGVVVVGLFLLLDLVPQSVATVVILQQGSPQVGGRPVLGPLTARTTMARSGTCVATETASVPFGAGSPRASAAVVEPRTCATRLNLDFPIAIRYTNGLAVTAGHLLNARLDLLSVIGTTVMLANVHFWIRVQGGAQSTPIHIRAGTVVVASTSVLAAAAATQYGIHVRMNLIMQLVSSTATCTFLLTFWDATGGTTSVLSFESIVITLTY